MDVSEIEELSLELLKDTPAEDELKKAFAVFEKVQVIALSLDDINDEQDLTLTKIGTVLSLDLFSLLLRGKKPKDITQEEWKDVAADVIDKAVLMDGQSYSVYIFDLYEKYIETSANVLRRRTKSTKRQEDIDSISDLASDLREKKEQLRNGEISEVDYTEDCLWISFDAMTKCLSVYISLHIAEEYGSLIISSTEFAVAYARLVLYRKEQELLGIYLENQYQLDEELEEKFNQFKEELEEETNRFNTVINNAFDTDIRVAFEGSVELAREAGVKEEEILKTLDDTDNYFLC